jgi:SPX domain protein involved in polyphosphate accumulation
MKSHATKDTGRNVISSFSRIEDKFILPQKFLPEFRSLVEDHLDRSYGVKEADSSLIQSIYFDSSTAEFFQHHFQKLVKRAKLRIRRYGLNRVWDNAIIFLECKYKINGTNSKYRFLMSQDCLDRFYRDGEIVVTSELLLANPTMKPESLVRRVKEVNQLIQHFHVRAQLNVEYKRLAFEKGDLRITIDQNLNAVMLGEITQDAARRIKHRDYWLQALLMRGQFNDQDQCLVEIKHHGNHPAWFDQFLQERGVSQSHFSKYCWGMTQVIDRASQERTSDSVESIDGGNLVPVRASRFAEQISG